MSLPAPAPARQRLVIVADDLTGAADAAAPFADDGAEVELVLTWPPPDGVDVLALVTDGRWRGAAEAADRVGRDVRRARDWGAERLFVKVDSTLRGNVRAEVGSALTAWGPAAALAAPAFPSQGRVLREGVLYVHGQAWGAEVAGAFPEGVEVVDAEDDDQLGRVAERVVASGAVAVGSAGLARALAAVLSPGPAVARRPSTPVVGVLVVVGTPHPVSRAQAAALLAAGALCLVVTVAQPVVLDEAVQALARGQRVLLVTEAAHDVAADSAAAQALARALGDVVAQLLRASPGTALVLTGGATALAVAQALGASALRVLGEVSPGVAVGELLVGDRRIPAITKSGGFGAADTVLAAVQYLEECA